MNDLGYMQEALALAKKASSMGEVPIGAIVVSDQQEIIGRGYNQTIHAIDPTAHAEIIALREAAQHQGNYRLIGATLYCTLEPCVMCAGALIQSRVGRVVFAAPDAKAGALVSVFELLSHPQLNHRAEIEVGVLKEASVLLLQDFFKQRR